MAGKLKVRKGATPEFPEESIIPAGSQDDLHVIRLVVDKKAPLITTDRPMIDDLQSSGITAKYDLSVLTPERVFEHL